MKPKCSAVWQIFKKTSEGIVFCSLCQREFVFHGNTTNMRDHIRRRHSNCVDSILHNYTDTSNNTENKTPTIKRERNTTSVAVQRKKMLKKGADKNVIEVVECELVGNDENNSGMNNTDMTNHEDDDSMFIQQNKQYKQTIVQRKLQTSGGHDGVLSFLTDIKRKHDQTKYQNEMSEQLMCPTLCSDPLDKFFSSMCGITKSLCPALQLCIKRKLFEAITEAEEAYINAGEQLIEKPSRFALNNVGPCSAYHENIVVCHKSCSFALGRFFASMCDTTKTFPKQSQLEIKRKLFEAVSKAEESSIHFENEQNKVDQQTHDDTSPDDGGYHHGEPVETALPDNYQYNVQFTALPTSTPVVQTTGFDEHEGTITVTLA